jgi:hypothetical protein
MYTNRWFPLPYLAWSVSGDAGAYAEALVAEPRRSFQGKEAGVRPAFVGRLLQPE